MRSRTTLLCLLISLFCSTLSFAQPMYPPYVGGGKDPLVKVAKETEQLFVRRGVLFNDFELQDIVDRIGETVFPKVQDDFIEFRIHLIRDPSPLLFSMVDGQIYIHTGLLARLRTEAELAAVIAHEAHHIGAHHHIMANNSRRKKANVAGGIAMALNRGAGNRSFPDEWATGTSYSSNMGHITRSVFTNQMEFDADAVSVGIIGQKGHPPMAALQAMQRLREDPELSTPSPLGSFTSTEELMAREGRLRELVDGLPVRSASATSAYAVRDIVLRRIVEMTIDDYIRLDRPGTAVELIDSMIATQPDAFLYAAKGDSHLALGPRPNHEQPDKSLWYINGKRAELTRDEVNDKYMDTEQGPVRLARNHQSALESYNTALQMDENNARAYRGLGDLYFEQSEYKQSGRNYIKYLKLAPDALDRPIVLQNLQHIKAELKRQKEMQQ